MSREEIPPRAPAAASPPAPSSAWRYPTEEMIRRLVREEIAQWASVAGNIIEPQASPKLIAAAREVLDTELGDMACIGSDAPAEHALGLLKAAVEEPQRAEGDEPRRFNYEGFPDANGRFVRYSEWQAACTAQKEQRAEGDERRVFEDWAAHGIGLPRGGKTREKAVYWAWEGWKAARAARRDS